MSRTMAMDGPMPRVCGWRGEGQRHALGMDVLFACATAPVVLSAPAALLPGGWLTFPVPVAAVPAPLRAQWARQTPVATRALRVEWLLQSQAEQEACALLTECPGPLLGEVGLEPAVTGWCSRWLQDRDVPVQRAGTLVFQHGVWRLADGPWAGGVADGLAVLAPLPGPRWMVMGFRCCQRVSMRWYVP